MRRRHERGHPVFTLARFREASNALVERISCSTTFRHQRTTQPRRCAEEPTGNCLPHSMTGRPAGAGDLASQTARSCVSILTARRARRSGGLDTDYVSDFHSPRGFDWQPATTVLWMADRVSESLARLIAIDSMTGTQKRGVMLARYALPARHCASSVAFYRGGVDAAFQNNLLIASARGAIFSACDSIRRIR